jgi:lathosterol oxidase
MDIVLEVFDTLLFDRIYSTLLPASSTTAYQLALQNNATSTFPTFLDITQHKWLYQPASSIISLQPTAWAYGSALPRDNIFRQATSLFLITWLFGLFIYFVCATLSYIFIFDKTAIHHPKFLKNQISLEMRQANTAMPIMALLTAPFFTAEVRGYATLYDTFAEAPFPGYNYLQFPFFILFTDFFIYFIHRGLHHPMVYKTLHKPHHKWIMPTPYASHAFHPLDGWAQSLPYHIFPFIFPLQKLAYIALFAFINIWTIMIHDGEYVANSPIINGAACHT